jgi:hypothetical protein
MGVHAAPSRGLIPRVALFAAVLVIACARPAPTPSIDPNADIVVPYTVAGNGRIVFTVRPRYTEGSPVTIRLDITAGSLPIRGPLSGRVLFSSLDGERVVQHLDATELGGAQVDPGATRQLQIVWDGRDTDGTVAPAETYGLTLDFVIGDETRRVGTVFEVRAP